MWRMEEVKTVPRSGMRVSEERECGVNDWVGKGLGRAE